jgi:hypothetical protein
MTDQDHWLSRVHPLGNLRVEIPYARTFNRTEADKLRSGFWPQDMDDKWIVFLGEASLELWRSWTGTCIFSLPARQNGDCVEVGPMFVNANLQQYRRTSDADDIQLFETLMTQFLAD